MSLLQEMEPQERSELQNSSDDGQSGTVQGIPVCLGGRNFVVLSMAEEASDRWTTARFMFHWRQLVVFRSIKATIVAPSINCEKYQESQEARNEVDDKCAELSKEWITLGNALVAMALRFDKPEEAEFIKTLGFGDKCKAIAAQDKLNGTNLIEKFAEIEKIRDKAEKLNSVVERMAQERLKELIPDQPRRILPKKPNRRYRR